MDFLIKNEKAVIEVKKTRKGLEEKEVGDQLIIDIERYRNARPECEVLFCLFTIQKNELVIQLAWKQTFRGDKGTWKFIVTVEPKH